MFFVVRQNKTMQKLFILLLLSAVFIACRKDVDDFKLKVFYVAPQKGSYITWYGATAYSIMVKEKPDEEYVILGQEIEGFDHVAGFEYKLEVKEYTLKNPPADASDKRYILKRIISKDTK
jgi:hypothetical protein